MLSTIHNTFSAGVIYVYSIPDSSHQGRLKIGQATIDDVNSGKDAIDRAAIERIEEQTKTADIKFKLEHAEIALDKNGDFFSDYNVHEVLKRSGFLRKSENVQNARSEWFEVDLDMAKAAIQAVKEGRKSLSNKEIKNSQAPKIDFRPSQKDAIDQTNKAIKKKKKKFLWNAKMRFGKTLAAMQVAKDNEFKRTLIITHRPSVSEGWREDFGLIFNDTNYEFSSNKIGESIKTHIGNETPFIYFASLQDLRLSKHVTDDESANTQAAGFAKNEEIFENDWDMVIIDEAHEGTQSNLAATTLLKINTGFTLQLSGTPFNILHKHTDDEIYTWDYVMEQEQKRNWDRFNSGIPNPYAELPEISMLTYDIDKFHTNIGIKHNQFSDALDGAFKFSEFFRLKKDDEDQEVASFEHEEMVIRFLDLLVNDQLKTKFPFATEEFRSFNKHSLWLLPNRVKTIKAMEGLLKDHPVFSSFEIVNISGPTPLDEDDDDAKSRVEKAIAENEYTITLTGQRLTTGSSIKAWTAVFMMSDTNSASSYLQTAFRCQTPAKIDGKLKTKGYVFDFAPDRTLRLVAEAIEVNHKSGKTNTKEQKEAMEKFLNFCPIIAASEGTMKEYDVDRMLEQLKKAVIERVGRNGFDDPKLYNNELLMLDELDVENFNNLRQIVGSNSTQKTNEIKINEHGMDDLGMKQAEEAERKKKKKQPLSDEEKQRLEALKEARKQKASAIDTLRAVSIRMPMLVFGSEVSYRQEIGIDEFIDLVDPESWDEFMPKGLTKDEFRKFTKYYDEDVFRGVAKNIRAKAKDVDDLPPLERVQAIAELFSTFKNPDKETVLTPWKVVNNHISSTLGGNDFNNMVKEKPDWKSNGQISSLWSDSDAKVLEINSKSGLYPLLCAYNFYTRKLTDKKLAKSDPKKLWNDILQNNVYAICKSPMAKTITERTLAGYTKTPMNVICIHGIVEKLRGEGDYSSYNINNEIYKAFEVDEMKFTAVVGNPPYQINTETNFAKPVYHLFFDAAVALDPDYVTMIHPARFLFNAGATPKDWNKKMLNDPHLSVPMYEARSQDVFESVDIKGGVCVTLWDKNNPTGGLNGVFVPFTELKSVVEKVGHGGFDQIISSAGGSPTKKYEDKYGRQRSYFRTSAFFDLPEVFSDEKSPTHNIKIVGLEKGNIRSERYVQPGTLKDDHIDKWKVFLPAANGSGAIGEALSTPLVGEPLVGSTESFIRIGSFDEPLEAEYCMKYIKGKFCRALLGVLKITQHNPRSVWRNVPIQDFTESSDIDWSQSIADIDKQLYKKYGLTEKEIKFIETNVRAME